jgi:hypothetical protein
MTADIESEVLVPGRAGDTAYHVVCFEDGRVDALFREKISRGQTCGPGAEDDDVLPGLERRHRSWSHWDYPLCGTRASRTPRDQAVASTAGLSLAKIEPPRAAARMSRRVHFSLCDAIDSERIPGMEN